MPIWGRKKIDGDRGGGVKCLEVRGHILSRKCQHLRVDTHSRIYILKETIKFSKKEAGSLGAGRNTKDRRGKGKGTCIDNVHQGIKMPTGAHQYKVNYLEGNISFPQKAVFDNV